MKESELMYKPIGELHQLATNPRKIGKKQFERLCDSLRANGWWKHRPAACEVQDGKLVVLAANQRLKAAKKIGMVEVPVIIYSDLTDDERKDIIYRDNISNGEFDLGLMKEDIDAGFDFENIGLDIEDLEGYIPEEPKRAGWGKAKDYHEPVCDMKFNLAVFKRRDSYFSCFYKSGKEGLPISTIKTEQFVEDFADNLCKVARELYGLHDTTGWAIVTAPKRRHKDGKNFATMVCDRASELLRMKFYEDAMICTNRNRIHPDMKLVKEISENNVLFFDDILTTGSTMYACLDLLKGKNVITVIGINNNV